MPALGNHLLADLRGCDPARLADLDAVRSAMLQAARESGATIITHTFHHFAPLGVSGVVIVSESHLAIHTWPEHGFAALDYFTCGNSIDQRRAVGVVAECFGATDVSLQTLTRG